MAGCRKTTMPWAQARAAARELGGRRSWATEEDAAPADAVGAALARELTALVAVPPYDASAMDGYAVAGPGPWNVRGRVLAGAAPAAALNPGEAVEIATGARVPEGTDAVLPYEMAHREGDRVHGGAERGRHVRRTGEDTPAGATVLPQGTVVTPAVAGLAASLGHDTLPVRRPRVAAFITGDEIAVAGRPGPGQVRDAIGPMLPGIAAWAGAAPEAQVRLDDGLDHMVTAVAEAADRKSDVVVVCGASSKGPADHLRAALAELDATLVVDGVACRPGHPQLLAHFGTGESPGTVVVGLPGNPNAALAAAVTLLVPVLIAMSGRADPAALLPRALPLAGTVAPHDRDTRLVAVRVADGVARPVGHDRPGSLRGAAAADAYAVVPPGWTGPDASLVWLPR
ncbi:molybdopterin molybdotransferase MoeA [Nocardiopsis mangrovi]|uniref:Molybdopterin molybdenumtransferase n=1 Tax=Nocardiopsis mangrovi TaxID=1179818 RepID=A0ABV9DQ67_9ACTN